MPPPQLAMGELLLNSVLPPWTANKSCCYQKQPDSEAESEQCTGQEADPLHLAGLGQKSGTHVHLFYKTVG